MWVEESQSRIGLVGFLGERRNMSEASLFMQMSNERFLSMPKRKQLSQQRGQVQFARSVL